MQEKRSTGILHHKAATTHFMLLLQSHSVTRVPNTSEPLLSSPDGRLHPPQIIAFGYCNIYLAIKVVKGCKM